MQSKQLISFLRYASIAANILFILWILYNGINEGFKGTTIEKISYISLMLLLATNAFLLLKQKSD